MANDEYHEAMLRRVQEIQREISGMSQLAALNYAYQMSREMPEDAVRMLVAELLLDYWKRTPAPSVP